MFRRLSFLTLILLTALCLTMSSRVAAQKGDEIPPPTKEQLAEAEAMGKHIEQITTAYMLAEYGREKKAPEALITAARMLREMSKVRFKASKEAPKIEAEKGQKIVDEAAPAPKLDDEAADLFDEAANMAKDLKLNVDDLIKRAKDGASRPPIDGPLAVNRLIGPRQVHSYNLRLAPQLPTYFGFRSSLPLRITAVRTDNANVYSAGITTVARTVWNPGGQRIAHITLRIENPTTQPVQYQFLVN